MKTLRILITIFTYFVGSGMVSSAPITTLYNTGVNNDETVRTHGQVELHYEITNATGTHTTGFPNVRTSAGGFPVGPWIGDNSTSAWIDTIPASGAGTFTYRTTFDLTGFDITTASITGQWAVDNTGLDILINGSSTGISGAGFGAFSTLNILSGFVEGVNTLDFIGNNSGGPGGLRTELIGVADLASPVPAPAAIWLIVSGFIGLFGVRRKSNLSTISA